MRDIYELKADRLYFPPSIYCLTDEGCGLSRPRSDRALKWCRMAEETRKVVSFRCDGLPVGIQGFVDVERREHGGDGDKNLSQP